jgi:hypothetical protein
MKIDIKRAVTNERTVKFEYYRSGECWYSTEFDEIFPVPVQDVGTATLLSKDKAILFMRYMRKYNEKI